MTPPAPSDVNDILHQLRQFVRSQLIHPPRVFNSSSFLDPRLRACFPYDGPCQVLSRGDKTFEIPLNGRKETVARDHLKTPAIEKTQFLVLIIPTHQLPFHPLLPPRLQSTQAQPHHANLQYLPKLTLQQSRWQVAAGAFVSQIALSPTITSECAITFLLRRFLRLRI